MPASKKLHVAHLSTLDGLEKLPEGATSEVCPHHLLLSLDNCDSMDCKVDPPLRSRKDNEGLYQAFREARIPILSSDHAPHTMDEKNSDEPPSGIPGVETMIPLMMNEVSEGRLELDRLINAMAEAPADRLGLDRGRIKEGLTADLIVVDLKKITNIEVNNLHSRASWTPYDGWPAVFPSHVYRRGELISYNQEPIVSGGGQHLFD
jgi:dihydroorotase